MPQKNYGVLRTMRNLLLLFLLASPAFGAEIVGVKIYYSKSVVKIPWADFEKQWYKAPADDVQVVRVFYSRTYEANGQVRQFTESHEGHDYYFWSPSKGFGGTNEIKNIPEDVPTVKLGRWMSDDGFLSVYNASHNDHKF